MQLNVRKHLKRLGKTKYWLYIQLGMGYTNFDNMIKNRTKSIKYEILEDMCHIFDCTPNDLLDFDATLSSIENQNKSTE